MSAFADLAHQQDGVSPNSGEPYEQKRKQQRDAMYGKPV